ncbi:MAG: transposase [Armatimonadota bacterium]
MAKRKTYSAELKTRAVLELLREKSLTQVASEYGVHPNQLRRWKQTALEQLPSLFTRDSAAAQQRRECRHRSRMPSGVPSSIPSAQNTLCAASGRNNPSQR